MQNVKKMRMLAKTAVLLVAMLLSSGAAWAQNVQGVVTDSFGEPLPGVSVVLQGSTVGAITNIDGAYTIAAKNGDKLVFSYIGFTEQVVTVNNRVINITMSEDYEALDELVVIGYGSMTRKDVTSSITTVKAEDLNKGVVTSPAQMLQGKVPGLTIANTSDPNGSASISLRGASSLRTGEAMEPYYVIDGIPGVSLSLVAPEDIESIDVLRDASATAIYGSKAANGIIIVTTKKGNKDGRTNVSYNAYLAIDNTMNSLDMMTGDEYLAYATANDIDISAYYDASNPTNTNWQNEVLRTGISHNHNVSINGGQGKTSYSASLSYLDRQGVVTNTSMNRMNARSFVQTSTLKDHLDIAVSVNASMTNQREVPTSTLGQSVIEAMYYYNPLVPTTNADGTWYSNTSISQNYNPLSLANEDQYNTKQKSFQTVGKATLHIIDGLDWNVNFSYENEQYIYNTYHTSASQLPTYASRNGDASRSTIENQRKELETYINYEKTFNRKHKLGLMGGYSWEQSDNNDGFGLEVYNFYNDELGYYNLSLANSMDQSEIISNLISSLRMISFYGRVNYSYDSKYLFQATIRRDGSSAFGENHRWATFPSASAAWRITEEQFMKNQNVFDDLKLRVGYGVSGNSLGFDAYTALQTYGASGWFTYTDANGESSLYRTIAATRNANPDLKWETTSMLNIGIDMAFLGGRLSGTVEVYNKTTKDLIYDYTVSTNRYPYSYMTANVGEINNKGIELTVNAVPVKTKDFVWTSSLNVSHNKNKVVSLSNDTYSVDYINMGNPDIGGYSTTTVQRIMEGYSIGTFYLWEFAGFDENGMTIFNDYDEDGNLIGTTDAPDDTDRREHGSAQPKVTFGWNNTLNYKNWALTAFFQGVAGNKIFNATRAYYNSTALIKDGKNILAEVAEIQNFTDTRSQAPSTRYLENGSYLRLSTLSLSYNFGTLKGWVQNLNVYATCNNVFTITGYKGIDPELNLGGLEPGIDWRTTTYPRTRTIMFGVNVNF